MCAPDASLTAPQRDISKLHSQALLGILLVKFILSEREEVTFAVFKKGFIGRVYQPDLVGVVPSTDIGMVKLDQFTMPAFDLTEGGTLGQAEQPASFMQLFIGHGDIIP